MTNHKGWQAYMLHLSSFFTVIARSHFVHQYNEAGVLSHIGAQKCKQMTINKYYVYRVVHNIIIIITSLFVDSETVHTFTCKPGNIHRSMSNKQ